MTNDNTKDGKDFETSSTKKEDKIAKYVEGTDITKMKIWDQFKLSGNLSKITRNQLSEIARSMVEKQKQEINHRLVLDLDINKKRAYKDYDENVKVLNSELIKRSNEMEKDLVRILRDATESIDSEREEWIKRIEARKLSSEAHKKETDRMNKWIDLLEQQAETKIEMLMKTHSESLQATLQLFKDTTLEGEGKTVLD